MVSYRATEVFIYSRFLRNRAPIIDEAVSKCEFVGAKNFSNNLEKFYNCVDQLILRDCPLSAIDSRDECDPVEEYYEKCKNYKPNCNEYPMKLIMPEFCCDYPEMVSTKTIDTCNSKCKAEVLHIVRAKCNRDCIEKQLGVKSSRKYDFDVLKKLLLANSNTSTIWGNSIETSLESCKNELDGKLSFYFYRQA